MQLNAARGNDEALAKLLPIASFARQSEERLGTTNVMQRWKARVMTRVTEVVDAIPLGEP